MELEDGCPSIVGTAFDGDEFMPERLRRVACWNPNTHSGCCMALCSSQGYRCQAAAKYALTVNNRMINDTQCEQVLVTPQQYVITQKKIKTGGEGILLLCPVHFAQLKKKASVWAAFVKPAIGKAAWIVCAGAVTAGAVAAVGSLATVAIPATLAAGVVQQAVTATLEKSTENAAGELLS